MRTLLRLLLLLPFWANLAQAQTLSLRAMTYNIHHDDTGSNRIAGVIFNAGAQLVGIQEVPNAATADAIASRLTTLTGKTWTARMMPTGIEGDAILSSYPIASWTYITMYDFNEYWVGSVRSCVQATVEVPDAGGQPHRLQFFVTHLTTNQQHDPSFPSPRFPRSRELVDFTKAFPGPRSPVSKAPSRRSRAQSDLS